MGAEDGVDGVPDIGREAPRGPAGASDARLTELLRADSATAFTALQELRARHLPSVLSYARLCTTSESVARQLAAQAFTLAAREVGRGIDPGVPWRHRLLLLTGRLAASWADDERAVGLDTGLLLVLNAAGPAGPVPPMLPAFQSLPSRVQGLIWYAAVERLPEDSTANHLGLTRADVTYGTPAALQQLARACLHTRLAASDDPDCRDFGRLIEEAVLPDTPRDSADLRTHMARCPYCTAAYEELSALRDDPRTTLAEGLLPWAGTAYVIGHADDADDDADDADDASGAGGGRGSRAGAADGSGLTYRRAADGNWPPYRRTVDWSRPPYRGRAVLVSVALGVALVPLVVFLVGRGGSSSQAPVSSVRTPTSVPPVAVTVTATVPASPSPSATSRPAKSPKPTKSPSKSPSPTRTARPKPPPSPTPSPTHPPNGTFAQVVNAASGLCLDVGGAFTNGTDVITAPCTSSRSQRWRVDSGRGVLQSLADPDYCLDSRGETDRGVGIWTCESVWGPNGQNLMFVVDGEGEIRPAIAVETAVTPDGGAGDGLSLERLSGAAEQRWRAGRS